MLEIAVRFSMAMNRTIKDAVRKGKYIKVLGRARQSRQGQDVRQNGQ